MTLREHSSPRSSRGEHPPPGHLWDLRRAAQETPVASHRPTWLKCWAGRCWGLLPAPLEWRSRGAGGWGYPWLRGPQGCSEWNLCQSARAPRPNGKARVTHSSPALPGSLPREVAAQMWPQDTRLRHTPKSPEPRRSWVWAGPPGGHRRGACFPARPFRPRSLPLRRQARWSSTWDTPGPPRQVIPSQARSQAAGLGHLHPRRMV